MGIKSSNLCGMCRLEVDSIEHMLLSCECTQKLWNEILDWIIDLGMQDYTLTGTKNVYTKCSK